MGAPLRISACLLLAGACAPGSVDTSNVELPRAEHGRALGPQEIEGSPVIEIWADGTVVVDGSELSVDRLRSEAHVLEQSLAELALRAPKEPLDGVPNLLFPTPALVLADGGAPYRAVRDVLHALCAPGISFFGARAGVTDADSVVRWMDMWLPMRIATNCRFSGERIEVRVLEPARGPRITVWWLERLPGTEWSPDRERNESRATSLADLGEQLDPGSDHVYVHTAPETRWSQVVEVLDLLASAGLEAYLSPVGDER